MGLKFLLGFLLTLQLALGAQPLSVAHRGGPKLGAENTLVTFQKALELGVDAIEVDVHQSLDGEPAVIHDSTLKRTHGIDGAVNQMTAQELGALGVPTLQQAVDLVAGRSRLFIEIKQPRGGRHHGIEERVVKIIKDNGLMESAVVISFDAETLRRVYELERRVSTGWLTGNSATARQVRPELSLTYISPHYKAVDVEFVNWAHGMGYKVSVWTVDDPKAMSALIDAGCDAITTNDPERLLLELAGRKNIPVKASPCAR